MKDTDRLTPEEWIRAESLRLGAEALRSYAEAHRPGGLIADEALVARYRAAAGCLDAIAADDLSSRRLPQ